MAKQGPRTDQGGTGRPRTGSGNPKKSGVHGAGGIVTTATTITALINLTTYNDDGSGDIGGNSTSGTRLIF